MAPGGLVSGQCHWWFCLVEGGLRPYHLLFLADGGIPTRRPPWLLQLNGRQPYLFPRPDYLLRHRCCNSR